VRVELELAPTGGRTVDELTLEIPLRADAATLLHANADRIRAPVAMRIGTVDGVVWDATKLACDDYLKNFCPYVYIGTPARGRLHRPRGRHLGAPRALQAHLHHDGRTQAAADCVPAHDELQPAANDVVRDGPVRLGVEVLDG
jgi:hypothetical protein